MDDLHRYRESASSSRNGLIIGSRFGLLGGRHQPIAEPTLNHGLFLADNSSTEKRG